ncbi:MAG: M28 family peptidase [Lentimicrobiaceae bacterium]|nr:M28 family peptidase [Lentimicrobiaceae bacterium]
MKKLILICCSFFCLTLSAQQPINNKGNRNQSYPVITETKPEVVQLINQVDEATIESHIRYMQQFFRVSTSPAALTVQNWMIDHFESYGYEDISVHKFYINSQLMEAGNVVVVKKGTEFPDEYIMITSHYDHSSWDYVSGPGADDNASGTAGVLECARLLQNFDTKRSIMFVPFSGEEFWMLGSLPFAKKCASENMNIIAHFNMDMIGWFPPGNPNTIMASGHSYISETLFNYYHQVANLYVPAIPTIRLSDGDSYGGDHMPFNMYEYPSLYIGDIEYHDLHPCYHKMCDTIGPYQVGVNCGVNRLDLARAFVQATLSAAAELANAWLPPQNLSACVGMNHIKVSWDHAGDYTFYKVYRNDMFLDVIAENFYIDNNVEVGNKYEYYVIAMNCENRDMSAPSNKDEVVFVEPLQLPYFNNFSANKNGFEQSNWVLRNVSGTSSLCNTAGSSSFSDNYLSLAELNWFPIPANTENITVRFKWQGTLNGIWQNAGLHFEVTNDRKTWHKLAYISSNAMGWKSCQFSLNEFIGSDFCQVRFRLESSGAQNQYGQKIGYITDVEIDFNPVFGIQQPEPSYFKDLVIAPNPTTGFVNITTFQELPYQVSVFNMTGQRVFQQDSFQDGNLNLSGLQSGAYIVRVAFHNHSISRKLVIQ